MLRLQSYLAPSIPYGFFRAIAEELRVSLREPVELTFETRTSGPIEGEPDAFSHGEIDIAFLCAPTYLWLERAGLARLLAAPVPTDPRAEGRPVYYSEVVVARDCTATSLEALRTLRWALNDPASLSGYRCVVDAIGAPSSAIVSGSHLASLELVRTGVADAAAIDSNVLAMHPLDGRLRVAASLGPHPIQPVVARADLDGELVERVQQALLTLETRAPDRLTPFGFAGFTTIDHAHYARSPRVRHRTDDECTDPGLRATP